jgi:HNH endonuclease
MPIGIPANHAGKRFGRLTVIEKSTRKMGKRILWRCKCDCGEFREVETVNLSSGHTTSCGCVNRNSIEWESRGDCFICTSHRPGGSGYPQIKPILMKETHGTTISRLILKRKYGNVESHIVARHTCDNRMCIRPDHIIPGTRADNRRDAVTRDRQAKGESHGFSKLTNEAVYEIRLSSENAQVLAVKFGVMTRTVIAARNRISWKHL